MWVWELIVHIRKKKNEKEKEQGQDRKESKVVYTKSKSGGQLWRRN